MVKKPSFQGFKSSDVVSPAQLREQARLVGLGRLQGRAKWWQVALALLVTVIIITFAAIGIINVMWATPRLDSSRFQVVFLDDGKVFFGKLKNTPGAYITLEEAYYTRTTQSTDGKTSADQTALVKVGSESYGPDNSLQIARAKILFWQNLRDDSDVTRAIKNKVGQ